MTPEATQCAQCVGSEKTLEPRIKVTSSNGRQLSFATSFPARYAFGGSPEDCARVAPPTFEDPQNDPNIVEGLDLNS